MKDIKRFCDRLERFIRDEINENVRVKFLERNPAFDNADTITLSHRNIDKVVIKYKEDSPLAIMHSVMYYLGIWENTDEIYTE